MPRDVSGNYTLPAGNPVVDGTIIETTWANPTMSDIALQLNNVITRDGLLGPTSPIKFPSGSAAAPSITFSSDADSGIYRVGADSVGLSVGGVATIVVNSDGSVNVPRNPLVVAQNTGFISTSSTSFAVMTSFTEVLDVGSNFSSNKTFTAPVAGIYEVRLQGNGYSQTGSPSTGVFAVYKNGVDMSLQIPRVYSPNNSTPAPYQFTTYVSLAATDTVEFWFAKVTGTADFSSLSTSVTFKLVQ